MWLRNYLALVLGKLTSLIIKLLHLGSGGTWPGELSLMIQPILLKYFTPKFKKGVVIIAGTNGKTTTSLMIKQILEANGNTVIHNGTGANLLNGIVSACIERYSWLGSLDADWGVFEVDENSLPIIISNINPPAGGQISNKKIIIVLLNLFRDQLDRYGEVDVIAEKWSSSLSQLNAKATVILNADDPQIAHLGIDLQRVISIRQLTERNLAKRKNTHTAASLPRSLTSFGMTNRIVYFGIDDKTKFLKHKEHATDSTFCLNCGKRLTYTGVYYSHVGVWHCDSCGEKRPPLDISQWDSPLPGVYSTYNTLAAVSVAKALKIPEQKITKSLLNFIPAFGRQEEFLVKGKKIKIFLSKNPAGFNQSLRTVNELGAKHILLILNDRIPDGRDVSWIWDVDFEMIPEATHVTVSGDRVHDLALRLKYGSKSQISIRQLADKSQSYKSNMKNNIQIEPEIKEAIRIELEEVNGEDTLYILPTYSAMLEVRKILAGKKIL